MENFRIKVYGAVQGVFYRDSAKRKADDLGLKGFVRNESDRSVLIETEGDSDKIKEFLIWCKEGSDSSQVERIEVETGEVRNFSDFEIRY